MKPKKELFVFDFDGTVVDSMEGFADIAADVIHESYGTPWKRARVLYMESSGIPFHEQLEQIFPKNRRNPETAETFEARKLENYFDEKTLPKLEETLQAARSSGVKVAVSSNNKQELVEEYLDKKGIQFDVVLGWKPNFAKGKDHFDYLKSNLNISSNGILFIGDSIKDAECADTNKVDFVGKLGTFTKDDFQEKFPECETIADLSELEDLL